MPRTTALERRQAKRMYEEDGETQAAIARHFNVTAKTVGEWVKNYGWVKAGTRLEAAEPEVTVEPEPLSESVSTPAEVSFPPPERSKSEAELRARIADLEAENERLRPTKNIGAMLDDRVQWLTDNTPEGERYWLNRAEAEFAKDNMDRAKQGLPVFDIKNHPDLLEDLIIKLKTKEATRSRSIQEPPSRKVKLYIERNGMPTIEQIPMENQVNNMAGSLADGIVRYTRKGFKLTDPFLCPRAGCFQPAAVDEQKEWEFDGYCSSQHRLEVEGDQQSPTSGLQTKDTILSGIR